MSKYREMFFVEAREHLGNMSPLLMTLEQAPADRAGIDALFREAHSLKGMAASMGFEKTTALAHHLEDLMDCCRKSGTVRPETVERLLCGIDLLEGLLEDLAADRPEREIDDFVAAGPAPAPPPSQAELAQNSPQLCASGLNLILKLAPATPFPAVRLLLILQELSGHGDIVQTRPELETIKRGGELRQVELVLKTSKQVAQIEALLRSQPDVAEVVWRAAETVSGPEAASGGEKRSVEPARSVRVGTALLDLLVNLTGELLTTRHQLQTAVKGRDWKDVSAGLDQLGRHIAELHHQVLQVRMMPLETVTGRLPRVVRELSRKTGKKISLRLEGQQVELDRSILEELADPLLHLVRNAVDHGIEQAGEILIRARREKDLAILEVRDNGRGIDPGVIRRKAVEKGLLTGAQAQALRDRDALQLICRPGFSTAATVTQTSGRGVGMDVVKSAIENLGGSLEIQSVPGKGTRFLLKLPLSVAIIHVLLLECDGKTLGIPVTRVLRMLEASRSQIRAAGRQMVLCLPGEPKAPAEEPAEERIPLLLLRKILRLPNRTYNDGIAVVITEIRGRKVGLVVDRLAGHSQVFVKPLAFPLNRLPLGGATVLGDGRVIFIIDPQTLLESSQRDESH